LRGTGRGELDIVAKRGRVVAFVEVKARPQREAGLHAVGPGQRRRIARAAAAYLARRPDLAGCVARFDVMVVGPGPFPFHLADAWRIGDP
jgi:putative endonuclease